MSSVRLETNLGTPLTVELFEDEAPGECELFLQLCKKQHYSWSFFSRIERDFIAEVSGPNEGNLSLKDLEEILPNFKPTSKKLIQHNKIGLVAMVDAKKSSKFYITLTNRSLQFLDEPDLPHVVFGRVKEADVFSQKINRIVVDRKTFRPIQDVYISNSCSFLDGKAVDSVYIVPCPSDTFLARCINPEVAISEFKKSIAHVESYESSMGTPLTANILKKIDKCKNPKEQSEIDEIRRRAITLEMIGERKSADLKAKKNVLFVARLNPVTVESDLETIFSRFGTIKSVQIVKDKITKNSLGYSFIEFETVESCEEAYLKMQNVVIDDRRIYVDFSQSVSNPSDPSFDHPRHPQRHLNYELDKHRAHHQPCHDSENHKYLDQNCPKKCNDYKFSEKREYFDRTSSYRKSFEKSRSTSERSQSPDRRKYTSYQNSSHDSRQTTSSSYSSIESTHRSPKSTFKRSQLPGYQTQYHK